MAPCRTRNPPWPRSAELEDETQRGSASRRSPARRPHAVTRASNVARFVSRVDITNGRVSGVLVREPAMVLASSRRRVAEGASYRQPR